MKATDFHSDLLNLFDRYVHGMITRREFFDGAAKFAVGGVTVASLVESLSPNYEESAQVPQDNSELKTEYVEYPSPQGAGTMRGYLARRADSSKKLPGVLVIHENRGLNPHIEDGGRRWLGSWPSPQMPSRPWVATRAMMTTGGPCRDSATGTRWWKTSSPQSPI